MKKLPDYIDNKNFTLEQILREIIEEYQEHNLDIATGFFQIEAWFKLETSMQQLKSFRLLIGRDPTIRPAELDHIDLQKHFRRELLKDLEHKSFNQEYKDQIERLIQYLQQEHIDVRLYGALGDRTQFLHAKAYIFDSYSIVGSSNFTRPGLSGNTELNILNTIKSIATDLRVNWFNQFWDNPSVDTEYKTKLIDTLNASKFGSKAYSPYQVFLKALYELFKNDSINQQADRTSVQLATFQHEGFERAISLIKKHYGCIIADAVGLGKTYIGLKLLDYYLINLRRPNYIPKALIICPAQLRDLVWRNKIDEYGIKVDIVSQEEISRDNFNAEKYFTYDIIVVDESHNFRNSATKRYEALQKILVNGNRQKYLVLLTATPINNSIFDLYHQISLLTRNNDKYYQDITNLKSYFQDLHQGKKEITDLLFQTMVRRSRQDVIKRQEAGEVIEIAGEVIKFPTRQLEKFTYNFEETFTGLYLNFATTISELKLAPYNIKSFKKKCNTTEQNDIKINKALIALQKSLYLKRLESSLIAFKKTVQNQQKFQKKFYEILTEEGKLLDSANFRKYILAVNFDEEDSEETLTDLFDKLEDVNPSQYQIQELESHIGDDIRELDQILNKIEQIEKSSDNQQYDRKLIAFKELLTSQLNGQKILVFSYFKDTAVYLHEQLKNDQAWLQAMNNPVIDIITGETATKQRQQKVKCFAPKANSHIEAKIDNLSEIDILICTDVLSEGQNLQDAGVLVNYDLHWNPVRMIQRAGRIDRLGTKYEKLYIYNCFPEEGLEELLNLVKVLQERINRIDREVGLDASVLGEVISNKSLEELKKLKDADTQADKQAILEELEMQSEIISLDEMRLPLLEFIQSVGREQVEDIPLGIHSTRNYDPKSLQFKNIKSAEGGLFLAFQVGDDNYWFFHPRIDQNISLDPQNLIKEKRQIFQWLRCQPSDFPDFDEFKPIEFDRRIFPIVEQSINQLFQILQKRSHSQKIKPTLSKTLQNIMNIFQNPTLDSNLDQDKLTRVMQIINNIDLKKTYEKDLKKIWQKFVDDQNTELLLDDLALLLKNLIVDEETESQEQTLRIIEKEDIKLVCYQWFKPLVKNLT